MNRFFSTTSVALLVLLTVFAPISLPQPVLAQQAGPALVHVWSNTCRSSNVTISNPACGTLQFDSIITVQVNVTNMPDFNAYDLFLYYDKDYLIADSVDEATGTVFSQPFLLAKELEPLGKIRVSVTNLGSAYTGRNGTLFHVNFKIKAVGVSPLTLAAGIATSTNFAKEYTRIILGGTPGTYLEVDTSDGYFKNEPVKRGPVAGFTFTPSSPQRDDVVTFDASSSFDADNDIGPSRGITEYRWDFGEGNGFTTASSLATHVFGPTAGERFYGNFSVRLTVVDIDTFKGMIARRVFIEQKPFHDVEVQSIIATPVRARPGDKVQITVVIFNKGTFSETYNLTVRSLGPPDAVLGTGEPNRFLGSRQKDTLPPYTFDTAGLSPGLYIVRASITVGIDEDSTNNAKDTVVNLVQESGSSILFIAAGGVAVAGSLTALSLLRRRRRGQDRQ